MEVLTQQDSLLVLALVSDAKKMSAKEFEKILIEFGPSTKPHILDAVNKELSQVDKFKSSFQNYNPDVNPETTDIIPDGAKHEYTSDEEYKGAKDNFNMALTAYNMKAMEMTSLKDDYARLEKEYFEKEDAIAYHANVMGATTGKRNRNLMLAMKEKYPDLFNEVKVLKKEIKSVRNHLGGITGAKKEGERFIPFNKKDQHDAEMASRLAHEWGERKPEYQLGIFEFKSVKEDLDKTLKILNAYEGDSTKTMIPDNGRNTDPTLSKFFNAIKVMGEEE